MADRPHFSLPFRFVYMPRGEVTIPVTDQDTPAEIADALELSLRTEQGDRRTLPSFGRPRQLAFLTDREQIRVLVQATADEDEPRARATVGRAPIDPDDPGVQRLIAMLDVEAPEESA